MSSTPGGMLKGRLSCMWSLYKSDGLAGSYDPVSCVTAQPNLTLVGEADTGEAFVERLLCQLKEFSGSLHIFRKHVSPCWDALSSGGHFRVEHPVSQVQAEAQMALFGKLEFICDVVAEKLAKSSMIAGVGLSVANGIMILSLWVVGTDSGIVEHLRNEILSRTVNSATRTTIRFIHHNTIPSERVSKVDPKVLSLAPMMSHLAIPGISINDLPSADEIGYTPPGVVSTRRRSFRDEESSPPLQHDASFSEGGGGLNTTHASLLRHSSSLSAFDHHRASMESGSANTMLPAPTPIADWASSWTPSMFIAAHRRSSTSSEGTATAKESSSTPRGHHHGGLTPTGGTASAAGGGYPSIPPALYPTSVNPPQPVASSLAQQAPTSGAGTVPSYARSQHNNLKSSTAFHNTTQQPTTIYIQSYTTTANGGYPTQDGQAGNTTFVHQAEGGYASAQQTTAPPPPPPVAGHQQSSQQYQHQPQPYTQQHSTHHAFAQSSFVTSSPAAQQQQPQQQYGGGGGGLHVQAFPFAHYQVASVPSSTPGPPQHSTAHLGFPPTHTTSPPPPLTRFPAMHQPYPTTVPGPPGPPTGSYTVEAYAAFANPQHQMQAPPPPQYSVYSGQHQQHGVPAKPSAAAGYQQLPPMSQQHQGGSAQHSGSRHQHHPPSGYQQQQHTHHAPSHHSRHAPPQSDRKAFIFRGMVYPAGLNRKEYRQIVHHSDDATQPPPHRSGKSLPEETSTHIEAFPAPPGYADCDVDPATYETLKTEHLLMRVRM